MNTGIVQGIRTHDLASWKDFYELISSELANAPAYIFRGQADADWLVESSLDRLEKRFPQTRNFASKNPGHFKRPPASRETHLRAFRQASRGRRGDNPQRLTDDECWTLAQHHGLATPMLDWTHSPFVALFFAFEEELRVDRTGQLSAPNNRAVFALSHSGIREKHIDADSSPRPFSPETESSRLIAQSGLFLKMPEDTDLEKYIRRHFDNETSTRNERARAVLMKIVIKKRGAKRLFKNAQQDEY